MRPALAIPCLAILSCATAVAQPLEIDKSVEPGKFAAAVGRRAMLLGREDGTFEAWINPLKLVRDFRLSVYFDGALEPAPLAGLAERIEARPHGVVITHSHAAFTIRQTWAASIADPVLVVKLDVETGRPLKLRASFVPEMKPMWPASFGGQSTSWDARGRVLAFTEGLRRFRPVMASPSLARISEQIGHQLPDRTIHAEMDIAQSGTHAIVFADSAERAAQADPDRVIREATAYYRDLGGRLTAVTVPEPVLMDAFRWAQVALDKGWQCDDGVGCGLVAGFGPSGASERPGFAWFFGGDALMNSWSVLDSGDFARVRGILEFLRDHQRADGKIPHEWPQSGALLDWSRYPYGYYHADTTPLYLMSLSRYVVRSGDRELAARFWESAGKAYRACLAGLDEDGLLSNRKLGAGAVETGALSGQVEKDVYLQGAWLAGLAGFERLAELAGRQDLAAEARTRAGKARQSLSGWLAGGHLAFAKLTSGDTYRALSSWQAMALAYGGLDAALARQAAASLSKPTLSTPWGTRLFATDSPFYDPLSYNDGSVWPFVTGFAIMAEFRNGAPRSGLEHLFGVAAMTHLSGAGYLTEYLSGQRAQALPRSVPHQLFSSAAVVHPLIAGLLGLDGDAIAGTLDFAPYVPREWPAVSFRNFRVGNSLVQGEARWTGPDLALRVEIDGPPLTVTLAGQKFPAVRRAEWRVRPAAEPPLRLARPRIGDRAP